MIWVGVKGSSGNWNYAKFAKRSDYNVKSSTDIFAKTKKELFRMMDEIDRKIRRNPLDFYI